MLKSKIEITNLKSALWLFFFQNFSLVLAFLKFSGQKDFSIFIVIAPLLIGIVASIIAGFFGLVAVEVERRGKQD